MKAFLFGFMIGFVIGGALFSFLVGSVRILSWMKEKSFLRKKKGNKRDV